MPDATVFCEVNSFIIKKDQKPNANSKICPILFEKRDDNRYFLLVNQVIFCQLVDQNVSDLLVMKHLFHEGNG